MTPHESPPAARQAAQQPPSVTLDALLRHAALKHPQALALADAPNREAFTEGTPLRLSYAEADRRVTAIAEGLRRLGLPTDSVIGVQMPNIVENVLTLVGVLRAGMIPAPLPLLWRRADTVAALARVGAKALVACRKVGEFPHAHFAMRVAAEVFSIRYVCAFGTDLPDGVVPFDDLFAAEPDPLPALELDGDPAANLAGITFDVGNDGPIAVARRHVEFLAGGLPALLEGGIAPGANILSAIAPASFGGICLTLVPWLLTGGTLALHHAFDAGILTEQRHNEHCSVLILPAAVAFGLAADGFFEDDAPTTVLAAWRSPEQLATSPPWHARDAAFVDIPIFGETALVAAVRQADGRPAPLPLGPVHAPRGERGVVVAELDVTTVNTLAWRGAMLPHHRFPPSSDRSAPPRFAVAADGFVDCGYPCEVDADGKTVTVTAPPSGIVTVGGYRFPLKGLLDTIGSVDSGATLEAFPDPLTGQRFVGTATDCAAMRVALNAIGLNPLVTAAFVERGDRADRTVGEAAAG